MLQKKILIFSFFGLLLFLASCGITSRVPKGSKPPVKKENLKGDRVIETGVASWYGSKFHGNLTANGERYNMYALTAAHRTLPFNTVLRVKNLDNGKSVVVRVNDRGPFAKNRIIDLSKKAAQEIDMIGNGTANVELILLEGDLQNSHTTDLKIATYTVQLGSFETEAGAFSLSRKIEGSRVEKVNLDGRVFYRVYYGTYVDKNKARDKQKDLQHNGFNGYVKQIEN